MTEPAGNTGVAGGTQGADPVPEKTAPDGSTALPPEAQPEPPDGEQNTDYPQGDAVGVSLAEAEKAQG